MAKQTKKTKKTITIWGGVRMITKEEYPEHCKECGEELIKDKDGNIFCPNEELRQWKKQKEEEIWTNQK